MVRESGSSPRGTIAAGDRRERKGKDREGVTRKGKASAVASVERCDGSVERGEGERGGDRSKHARRGRGGKKRVGAAEQALGSRGEEETAGEGRAGLKGHGATKEARGVAETGRRGRAVKAKAEGRVGRLEERQGGAEGRGGVERGGAERSLLRGLRLEDFPPAEQGALVAERQAESETLEEEEEGEGEEEVRGGEEEEEVVGLEGGSEEGGGEAVQEEIQGLLREAIAAEEAEARQVEARQAEARQVRARQVEARSAPTVAGTAAAGKVTRRVKRGWVEGVIGRGREGREREGSGGNKRLGELEVAGLRDREGEEGGATIGEGGRALRVVATQTHTETVPVSEEQQVVTVTETTVQLQVQQVGVQGAEGEQAAAEAEAEEDAVEVTPSAAPAVPPAWRLDEQQPSESRQGEKGLVVHEVGKQSAGDTGAADAAAGPRGVKRPAAVMTQAGGGGAGGGEGAGVGGPSLAVAGPTLRGPGMMGLGGMVTAMDERMMEVVVRHALQAREEAQRRKVQESARAVRDMRGRMERRRREARRMEEERDERLREMEEAVHELVRAWCVRAGGLQVACRCGAREEAQRRAVQERACAVRDMRGKLERSRREVGRMEEERDERLREMADAVQELVGRVESLEGVARAESLERAAKEARGVAERAEGDKAVQEAKIRASYEVELCVYGINGCEDGFVFVSTWPSVLAPFGFAHVCTPPCIFPSSSFLSPLSRLFPAPPFPSLSPSPFHPLFESCPLSLAPLLQALLGGDKEGEALAEAERQLEAQQAELGALEAKQAALADELKARFWSTVRSELYEGRS
ncbi:unnamed protein product [Closterium sp. Naga37s-1]|nr:unnamed protein product [Closterium sp. Naga37s-1]